MATLVRMENYDTVTQVRRVGPKRKNTLEVCKYKRRSATEFYVGCVTLRPRRGQKDYDSLVMEARRHGTFADPGQYGDVLGIVNLPTSVRREFGGSK